jgi:hypothetical protein
MGNPTKLVPPGLIGQSVTESVPRLTTSRAVV